MMFSGRADTELISDSLGACRTYEFRLQIRRNRTKYSPIFIKYAQYSPQTGKNFASIFQKIASKS
jgi:hypothetical protein